MDTCVFSVNGRKNILGDLGKLDLFPYWDLGQNLIGEHTIFGAVCFQKGQHVCYYGVSHWSLGTKVVTSALRMLALYMYFNGTGIWGVETL